MRSGISDDSLQKQEIQESVYDFPYHHIPTVTGEFAQVRSLSWGYEYTSYLRFVLERLQRINFESLLDVGCGDGKFLCEVARQFPSAAMTGIDISQRAIGFAKAFATNGDLICGDIRDKSLKKQFDLITLIETLEHIHPDDICSFLESLDRHLKPEGILIITTPSTNRPCEPKHYQHFNLISLRNTLNPFFVISEHYFLNRFSKRVLWLNRLLENRVFILNQHSLVNRIYRYYEQNHLFAEEFDAKRLCVVCTKRASRE